MSPEDAYSSAGVDYEVLDAAKRRSISAVLGSLPNPEGHGAAVSRESVGEPAQLFTVGGLTLATVLECLGTKSEIAFEVEMETGKDCWAAIGRDALAAVLNDLCCSGALPLTVSLYLATGSARWYSGNRHASLVEGWRSGCDEARAAWVGGESPTLAGLVAPDSVDVAGSAVGLVPPGRRAWTGERLEPGDAIVLVGSNGLHANGASLARAVARRLPRRWATRLGSGLPFGEAVLAPSLLYPPLVEALQTPPLDDAVHYASHVTGHGLRKLMRADRELTYRLERLLPVPEVLSFLAARAGLDDEAAYGTFNMGVGFALFVAAAKADEAVAAAEGAGFVAVRAGEVEEGPRQVVLEPLRLTYSTDELKLR